MENKFGGSWTEQKINILETYAIQFLKVFKNSPAKNYYTLMDLQVLG